MNNDIIATVLEEVANAWNQPASFPSALERRIAELRKPAPLAWPEKPSWLEWHNPDNLTPEQVGEGYRLLTTKEREQGIGFGRNDVQRWFCGEWDNNEGRGYAAAWTERTYRVPASTPYPEWQLPEPPPGRRWHRDDFTPDMLPQGYRPLLEGEAWITGDEIRRAFPRRDKEWQIAGEYSEDVLGRPASKNTLHCRTKRPLPALEPTQAEKDEAFADQQMFLWRELNSGISMRDIIFNALAYARKEQKP